MLRDSIFARHSHQSGAESRLMNPFIKHGHDDCQIGAPHPGDINFDDRSEPYSFCLRYFFSGRTSFPGWSALLEPAISRTSNDVSVSHCVSPGGFRSSSCHSHPASCASYHSYMCHANPSWASWQRPRTRLKRQNKL